MLRRAIAPLILLLSCAAMTFSPDVPESTAASDVPSVDEVTAAAAAPPIDPFQTALRAELKATEATQLTERLAEEFDELLTRIDDMQAQIQDMTSEIQIQQQQLDRYAEMTQQALSEAKADRARAEAAANAKKVQPSEGAEPVSH